MDATLRLRLELDKIKTEHMCRDEEDSREDLHERTSLSPTSPM